MSTRAERVAKVMQWAKDDGGMPVSGDNMHRDPDYKTALSLIVVKP